jgi:hypothetical protein
MGGIDKVKIKLQSYSHQENNQSHIINNIDKMMNVNDVIYDFRGDKSIKVPISKDTHPEYLVNNIELYNYLIKE